MVTTIGGLRTGEAARMIGVSEQTIRSLVRRGLLRAMQTPHGVLIDDTDAHRLAAERERAGAGVPPSARAGRATHIKE